MEEKIKGLYKTVVDISAGYLIYQKRDNITSVKKIIPQLQEVVLWFLEENRFGIEEELYQELQGCLLQILKDILDAVEQGDRVLLQDAIAYGLIEFLKPFVESGQEEQEDDGI